MIDKSVTIIIPEVEMPWILPVQYSSRMRLLMKAFKSLQVSFVDSLPRRKIRLIEDNAKCRHQKIVICKGTFRQLFTRDYRLETANFLRTYIQSCWYFQPSFVTVLSPVPPIPWFNSLSPLPCVNKYTLSTGDQHYIP